MQRRPNETGHFREAPGDKARRGLLILLAIGLMPLQAAQAAAGKETTTPRPNVAIVFADDLGYGDLGVYGGRLPTPNLDRMAAEGMRFTEFYAGPLCSPSRAALLTGCYAQRVGVPGGIGPRPQTGINPAEKLLPEILQEQGYRTALIGKWHLGHRPPFLPLQNGFDEYFGTPASNDTAHENNDPAAGQVGRGLLLFEGNRIAEIDPDQDRLTVRYVERAVRFIAANKARPFFLYLALNAPPTPLAVSARFRGKSGFGLYGDVVAEVDWAAGEILSALEQHGLDDRTLVIFTSDNGPWLIFGDHGGSAGPLRGGKKQTFEGGLRVPCIMRWPGVIPTGRVCRELAATMDILPTVTRLASGELPAHRIDGLDIQPLLRGEPNAKSPRETFFYYWQNELHAVRNGRWKLQLPHLDAQTPDPRRIGMGGKRGEVMAVRLTRALYDLENDPGEQADVAGNHAAVVRQLEALAEEARDDLGDTLRKQVGRNVRGR